MSKENGITECPRCGKPLVPGQMVSPVEGPDEWSRLAHASCVTARPPVFFGDQMIAGDQRELLEQRISQAVLGVLREPWEGAEHAVILDPCPNGWYIRGGPLETGTWRGPFRSMRLAALAAADLTPQGLLPGDDVVLLDGRRGTFRGVEGPVDSLGVAIVRVAGKDIEVPLADARRAP